MKNVTSFEHVLSVFRDDSVVIVLSLNFHLVRQSLMKYLRQS